MRFPGTGLLGSPLTRALLRPVLVLLATVVGVGSPHRSTADCVDYTGYLHTVGGLVLSESQPTTAVAVAGENAYATTHGTFHVVSLADPTLPVVIGTVPIAGTVVRVRPSSLHAYLASGANGLEIVDVSDPTSPKLVDTYSTGGSIGGVAIADDIACLTAYGAGMILLDVSNPTAPVLLGEVDTPGIAMDVSLRDGYAFVAEVDSGLTVVDVRAPTVPMIVERFTDYGTTAVHVSGGRAYVATVSDGLAILDVTDPADVRLSGTVAPDWSSSVSGVAVRGTDVFTVAGGIGTLVAIDAAGPTAPFVTGVLYTGGALAASSQYIVTARMSVVDIASTSALSLEATLDLPCSAMLVSDDVAYLVEQGEVWDQRDVQVLDMAEPLSPAVTSTVDTPGEARDFVLSGERLYVADGTGGLAIVNVSIPTAAYLEGSVDEMPGIAEEIALSGTVAYVTQFDLPPTSLHVFNVANPTAPLHVRWVETPGLPSAMATVAGHLLVGDTAEGLVVMSLSNPLDPTIVHTVELPAAWRVGDILVDGGTAYVTADEAGIYVVDVSDPVAASLLARVPTVQPALELALEGSILYVSLQFGGLMLFDVSDPARPVRSGETVLVPEQWIVDVALSHDYVYAPTGDSLVVFPRHCSDNTPVLVEHTEVTVARDAVVVEWSTGDTRDVLGFDLIRRDVTSSEEHVVNDVQLPPTGRHRVEDRTVVAGRVYHYFIECVLRSLSRNRIGPLVASVPDEVIPIVHPNPFASAVAFSLPRAASDVSVHVYDVLGRVVRHFESIAAGTAELVWDGRDDRGFSLAAGTYYADLTVDGRSHVVRVVLDPRQ